MALSDNTLTSCHLTTDLVGRGARLMSSVYQQICQVSYKTNKRNFQETRLGNREAEILSHNIVYNN